MLFLCGLALLFGIHRRDVVTISALLRVCRFHVLPNTLRQFKPMGFKLGGCINGTCEVFVEVVGRFNFANEGANKIMGDVAIRTNGLDARPVFGMNGVFVLLVIVVLHLMTGNAEAQGVGAIKHIFSCQQERCPQCNEAHCKVENSFRGTGVSAHSMTFSDQIEDL